MIDSLTQIPSHKALEEALGLSKQPKLFVIDIVQFKTINLSFGDEGGDFVLQCFSKELSEFATTHSMTLYRVKNDQFALLLEAAFDLSKMETIILALCEATQNRRYTYGDKTITLSAHIGISFDHFHSLEKAYKALLVAKTQQQPFATYSEFANTLMNESKEEIHQSIQEAIQNGKITLLFQAIVKPNQTPFYYESLVRFDSFDTMQSPMLFIKIAREKKVYPLVLQAIVEKILLLLHSNDALRIGINLSASDLLDTECFDFLKKELKGQKIIFEIHFDDETPNQEHIEALQLLKNEGFSIVLDGVKSPSLLEAFDASAVDGVKISGDLIRNLANDVSAHERCLALLSMAQNKGFQTIATHINAKSTLEKVHALPFDLFQGYSFELPHPL